MNQNRERPNRKESRKPNPRPETGTAWLSGLIVTVAGGGVALLTTSIMSAIYLAAFLTAALTVVLALLRC
ncbi:hypothetical protein [Nocardia sp. NBC_01329]|uniref:hypothetical protein n=1 Tax=Nocardia sp. NBC_01329 TaxID=2903594 RepID=UPI002E123218|nr:hypothetical protein OG405_14100 [Nocardia sp. NBC_01329]